MSLGASKGITSLQIINMTSDLIKIRVRSFFYELGALVLTLLGGLLLSDDFATIITNNFGETVLTSIVLLAVTALGKHIRNVKLVNKLGASGERPLLF